MSKAKGEATPMSEAKQVQPAAPAVGISKDDLIQVIEAVRKPIKSEKEIQDERNKEQERSDMRAIYAQKQANDAANKSACQHEHESGVGTPVVFVASLNRLYCQHCALWIFPTPHEAAQNGSLVKPELHPALWNRHLAKALASGLA